LLHTATGAGYHAGCYAVAVRPPACWLRPATQLPFRCTIGYYRSAFAAADVWYIYTGVGCRTSLSGCTAGRGFRFSLPAPVERHRVLGFWIGLPVDALVAVLVWMHLHTMDYASRLVYADAFWTHGARARGLLTRAIKAALAFTRGLLPRCTVYATSITLLRRLHALHGPPRRTRSCVVTLVRWFISCTCSFGRAFLLPSGMVAHATFSVSVDVTPHRYLSRLVPNVCYQTGATPRILYIAAVFVWLAFYFRCIFCAVLRSAVATPHFLGGFRLHARLLFGYRMPDASRCCHFTAFTRTLLPHWRAAFPHFCWLYYACVYLRLDAFGPPPARWFPVSRLPVQYRHQCLPTAVCRASPLPVSHLWTFAWFRLYLYITVYRYAFAGRYQPA